jgi:RNA polymerase sigma-70 factor (ECF subfamily)
MTEQEAIAQLKRGDIEGLRLLVERHQLKAVRVATLITYDRALAEDVVQDAFVRMHERIAQFDSSRPFEPWFLRIVTNGALKALRRRKFEAPLAALWGGTNKIQPAGTGADPVQQMDHDERLQRVQEALGQLTPKQRAAIVLRYYAEMRGAEMAESLGIGERAVKARLTAARRRLETLLQDPDDEARR